jgi:hypothetical protein
MAKYKDDRAGIRGHENRTIQNPKPDSSVSLSQASTSTARCSSGKQSRTPPCQNSRGRDCRQQDYHRVPYFLVGLAMPMLWGPPPMTYPPCPPWAGWYGPWASPLMHFHPGWSGPVEGFGHGGYFTRDGCYGYIGHQHDSKTLRQENRMVQNLKPNGPISSQIATTPYRWQE